jgi:hypothetical protein
VAIANYGLSYGLPGKAAPASPPRLPPMRSPASPAGKRVVHFTPRQLQQLAEQLETVTKAELKVRCFADSPLVLVASAQQICYHCTRYIATAHDQVVQ